MDAKHPSAQQQASRATIEDVQEMTLRMELIYRMAREIQKGQKQVVATAIREQPVVPAVSPAY
jgi:hypothetical protein